MPKLAQLPANDRAPERDRAQAQRLPRLQPRYFAFLSYSHKDKDLADWLHRELERFRVPRSLAGRLTANGIVPRRLTPIFRDEQDLAAAGDLGGEIKAALGVSQYLIVLCSPTAAVSRWTNAEIEWFKRDRPEGCVLAAIAAGEPFASEVEGRQTEECFPPALRQKYDRRGRPTGKRAEPLAADFRVEGDSRRTGFLKLVAGMLGVGLDELVHRETTRRHRRLAWLAAASVVGMAVTSTLAFAAFEARNAAREQRREAEGLVAFMLGDLKDKLEPIGRLDALDGVGTRVLAYYSKQDASELSDAALLQRSRALSLTAQVAYLRGNYGGAARLYREATAGTSEAVRRNPGDPQRLYDHAQNVFWVGELSRRLGDIAHAEAAFREYRRLADQMVAIAPDNLKYRIEVQYAREDLGMVLMSQRRFGEAEAEFEAVAAALQSMIAIEPGKREYQSELGNALGWLADAQKALGRFDDAIAMRQRQASYLDRLVGRMTDVAVQQQLIPAHQALGILFTSRGDTARGTDEYRQALASANALIAIEPSNSYWKDMAASVQLELAKSLLSLGRKDEAAQNAAAGCSIAAALRMNSPNVARWRSLQTTCLEVRSRLALASGAIAQAQALAAQALVAARSERTGDPATDRYTAAGAYRVLGDVRLRAGDREGALDAWSAGVAQLPNGVAERPWETYEHAELLRRLGRVDEARPLAARLAAIGYRSVI